MMVKGTSNLAVQLRIQEVVVRIEEAEGCAQQGIGRGAVGRVDREAVVHEGDGGGADVLRDVVRNGGSLVERAELVDGADGFLLGPGTATGEHLKHHATQRPNVDLGTVALSLAADDLGRHPENGALHAVGDVVAVDVVRLLGNTKIRDLASTVEVEQDVVGLEIAVEDALAVKVSKTAERLARE